MTFSSITSWQINREKVEAETNFIFLGSKITAERNFSCEIQRHAPWKESYNNSRKHIEKQMASASRQHQRLCRARTHGSPASPRSQGSSQLPASSASLSCLELF